MSSLDGTELAASIRHTTKERATALLQQGITPTLAVVVATNDEQTAWYVRSIAKAAATCNIETRIINLGGDATATQITDALTQSANDPKVHGIILQTPLPVGTNESELTRLIPPGKDVDGANSVSTGRLARGLPAFAPATAEAVMQLLEYHQVPIEGCHAVIVGRSHVVGKPVSLLLLEKNATVTICHSKTRNLAIHTSRADIIIAAAGRAGLVTPEHVRDGAVVIDVGTNVTAEGNLVGDVDPAVAEHAALSPVPGGVGPVTSALILQHTITAVESTPTTI